jgi:hypothetical protein
MVSDIPSRTEDQEVSEWNCWVLGFGSENAEDRGVDVILGDAADIDEFLHSILVWNVAFRNVNDKRQKSLSGPLTSRATPLRQTECVLVHIRATHHKP